MKLRISNPRSGLSVVGGKDFKDTVGPQRVTATYQEAQRRLTLHAGNKGGAVNAGTLPDTWRAALSVTPKDLPVFGPFDVEAEWRPNSRTFVLTVPKALRAPIQHTRNNSVYGPEQVKGQIEMFPPTQPAPQQLPVAYAGAPSYPQTGTILIEIGGDTKVYVLPLSDVVDVAADLKNRVAKFKGE